MLMARPKILFSWLALLLTFAPSAQALSALPCPTLAGGQMIRVEGRSSIYVVNNKGEFLYMPNGDVFKSWNSDEKYAGYYTLLSQACFDQQEKTPKSFPAGINFRPGSYVIKRSSSNQLYVVLPHNTIAKITPEAAKALYGATFKPMVIADYDWSNYVNRTADITTARPHDGMLVRNAGKIWYVDGDRLHDADAIEFANNRFKMMFVRPVTDAMVSGMEFVTGGTLNSTSISDRTQTILMVPVNGTLPASSVPTESTLTNDQRRIADLQKIQTALASYYKDQGSYPIGSSLVLGESTTACLNSDGWNGTDDCAYPYLAAVPKDPGGRAYRYTGTATGYYASPTYAVEATLDGTINGLSGAIRLTPSGIGI